MCGPSWPAPRAVREASYAALRCPLRHPASAVERSFAAQSYVLAPPHLTNKKGAAFGRPLVLLVEAGGIEPPSEDPTSPDLHA